MCNTGGHFFAYGVILLLWKTYMCKFHIIFLDF